jgi:beta-N-acetylhexosaminidase
VDEEVATVRKSLEQLKQIELAPFFAVTGKAPNSLSMADGVLVSHIRFQGFQGNNIRAATRPVSFDPTALGEILDLPELSTWRENGGLIISDDLGNRAVRFFYSPTNEGFSAELVARDAFLAGNDLLYLGNIVSSDLDDTYATNLRILNFFSALS